MPKYDYHCDVCDQTFELKLPFGSPIDQACPKCDSGARRLLTPPALVFKGSGFYETDYRSDAYKKAAANDKKAAEAKPESKSKSEATSKAESTSSGGKSSAKKKAD